MQQRHVCVIGAGISGLVTAKVLAGDGFDVVVFEKAPTLGGVWAACRTYPGLRTNNPRDTYAFSDHPFPPDVADFPSAAEMRAYLQSYAERFGLLPRIRVGTEVAKVAQDGDRWKVTVRAAGSEEILDFDFVVVCNGVFSTPRIPAVEGMERFTGRIVHSASLTDPELVKDLRVLVVGGGKSALDCAAWAAAEGRSCTLVFRQAYWMWPRYLGGVVNVQWLMFSRLTARALRYHRLSRADAWLHGAGAPLLRLVWAGVTRLLRAQAGISGPLVPDAPLPRHLESIGIGTEAYALVRSGRIRPRKSSIRRFRGGTAIELDDGEVLDADVVIFATGFTQAVPFLEESIRRQIEREDGFHLYRFVLPPGVPRLGFIGYNSSTACQLTSEVAAHWLSDRFLGRLRVPSVEDMNREIERVRRWTAEVMPARSRGFFVGPWVVPHLDELMRDMGLPAVRSSNFIAENLLPVWPTRYRTLAEERRRARNRRAGRFYLSAARAAGVVLIVALWWMLH
ncbi:MAG: NAD(P)/FAD-dependent oxidoreductase [Deltaproteobacteria bacterium]|nr:MAG: NAD(P)/FAD-dependent oxidoreductase [Deltaproteobacteria bacterium]